jgi:DNA polymerase III subunit delta'
MASFEHIIGQENAIGALQAAIHGGKLAHAYLFAGPAGVGKYTTAIALAQLLNCTESTGCGQCLACEKIANQTHPDVTTLRPDGRSIKIDAVRQLEELLAYAPHEGRRRLVIIDEAEKLTLAAANAMLKSVEEPRSATVFIFVTGAAHQLVATLRSRCQRLRFSPLSTQHTLEIVRRHDSSGEEIHGAAVALAEGSPGRALELLASEQTGKAEEIGRNLLSAARSDTVAQIFAAAADAGRDRNILLDALRFVRVWLRDVLLAKEVGSDSALIDNPNIEAFTRQLNADTTSQRRILSQLRAVQAAHQALQANANPALTLETLMLNLRPMKAYDRR